MASKKERSVPLNLALVGKKYLKWLPQSYEPPSSYRASVASTGEGEGHSPLFLSPETTYRSSKPVQPKDDGATQGRQKPLTSPRAPPRQGPGLQTPRRGYLKPGIEPVKPDGRLMSPHLVHAKKRGEALPPLKEQVIDMLHEDISPHTKRLIEQIPKETMLREIGASVYSNDPMFTEDVRQYQLDHPVPPYVLQKFPNYKNYPLLLNVIDHPDMEPNIKDVTDVRHLRGHNEVLLENKWKQKQISQSVSLREGYMYVPNFGRVQVVLTDYPDGKSYPLVTLPKTTPHDILNLLDRMKTAKRRSWFSYCQDLIRSLSCGML